MPSAISDTGPILHLHEIGQLDCLKIFDHVIISVLVDQELRELGFVSSQRGIGFTIARMANDDWKSIVDEVGNPIIHLADAQVFALARSHQFQELVLTDDLALRRHLENAGATVVGTIGILVRAYSSGWLARIELEKAVDALFTASTLHLSGAFKAYIQKLLADLPDVGEK